MQQHFKSVQNFLKKSQKVDNTERSVEENGGIIHPVKKQNKKKEEEEKKSLLQSEQEQRSKHKIHQVVLKTQSHNHSRNDEVWGDKRPCKRF